MTPLTPKEYVALGGGRCPFCCSEDIAGDSLEIDGGGASQEVGCGACDAVWIDTYKLTGYVIR